MLVKTMTNLSEQEEKSSQLSNSTAISLYDFGGTKLSELVKEDPKRFALEIGKISQAILSGYKIQEGFVQTLINLVIEENKTLEWLQDATKHVLKTCEAFPSYAHFFKFDKLGIKNYMFMYRLCQKTGRSQSEFIKCENKNGEVIWWDSENGSIPNGWKKVETPVEKPNNVIPINQKIFANREESGRIIKNILEKLGVQAVKRV